MTIFIAERLRSALAIYSISNRRNRSVATCQM